MPATVYADKGDLTRVDFLQGLAVPDRDQPVLSAMNDVGMASYFCDPFIGAQLKAQYNANRQNREKTFKNSCKIKIRGIKNQVTGIIV